MKIGTVVKTRITGLGIYMYPHEMPVEPDTICSVMSGKKNRIFHLPYSEIIPYNNVCWRCGCHVDSANEDTCPTCHWVTCPHCGACKRPQCESDGVIVLDANDPHGWEETTGFYYEDFFDDYANDEYYYLGQGLTEDVEKSYLELQKHQLQPVIVVNNYAIVSLYIENKYKQMARSTIHKLNIRLTYSIIDDMVFGDYSYSPSGECIFCGSSTYGDTLCPTCANNVD